MSNITKYNPTKVQTSSWEGVRYWASTATRGAMVFVAAQVMAGFTLNDLHKTRGIKPGARTDLAKLPKLPPKEGNLPHDAGGSKVAVAPATPKSWPEMVKEHAGISEDTARRWMATADGVKAKWKKNPPQRHIAELMDLPMSEWTENDTNLVFNALSKAIDGSTMIEFMREIGLAKKPQGAGATGRLPDCDNSKKNLSMSEEVELRRTQARVDWVAVNKLHMTYRDKFVVLADDEITAQIAVLEQDLNARKAWLKQPATKRDAKAIAEMFNVKTK